MPAQDIFVIGASAGGVEALQNLVCQLPADLPAALFVVLHLQGRAKSLLPQILSAAGPLPAKHAEDGEPIQHGRIYVAPPDRHLIVERQHIHLSMGPKEEHHRPCINVTFRSAAGAFGERVTGIVLTGELDDGTAGLWEIKRHRGIAIVQNPEEALFPSMPLNALREIEADFTVSVKGMGELIARLAFNGGAHKRTEVESNEMETKLEPPLEPKLTDLTCPDCRGTIWEMVRGTGLEYFCRVGHRYSAKSMLVEHFAAQEKALYAAMVALEEGASLAGRLADQFEGEIGERLRLESREHQLQAETVRRVLQERQSFNLD